MRIYRLIVVLVVALHGCAGAASHESGKLTPAAKSAGTTRPSAKPQTPSRETRLRASAERMIRASESTLAPVYAPLAKEIVRALDLAGREGVGIDIGSGPGTLLVELCCRTRLHWINADINPYFFTYFRRQARARGVGHRVSAIRADAQDLPFRDNYADVIVSRGSYHFWPNRPRAFREVVRVLKPGGVGYIGRGFPATLGPDVARKVRSRQGKRFGYDRQKEADSLRKVLHQAGAIHIQVHLPSPRGADGVNYGVWAQFQKPPTVNPQTKRRVADAP